MTVTIHHLRSSQSERIVWLCEELRTIRPDWSYELIIHTRDPDTARAPAILSEIHPAGTAPMMVDTTVDPPVILAESQAISDYLIQFHGRGALSIPPESPDFAEYINWYNFANGSLQSCMHRLGMMDILVKSWKKQQDAKRSLTSDDDDRGYADLDALVNMFRGKLTDFMRMIENALSRSKFLAGDALTAADIMTVYSLTTMRGFCPFSLEGYNNILRYLQLIAGLPGYQKTMTKAEPDFSPMIEADVREFDFTVLKYSPS